MNNQEFEQQQKHINYVIGKDYSYNDAEKIVNFLLALEYSTKMLPGYASLNYDHLSRIDQLVKSIEGYAKDKSNMRPLNWLLIANPGLGKSHFIDCIAKKLKNHVSPVMFNMASMRNLDDLASYLDKARNVSVDGKIPLLFLDEFDNDVRNYGLLLPLLWDGEMLIGPRRLKLGRAIIVLAGSTPEIEKHKDFKINSVFDKDNAPSKLKDLFSRINGGCLTIPDLNSFERGIDKICIAIMILRRQFEKKDHIKEIPVALLCFLYETKFRYGVRSIENFIKNIIKDSSKVSESDGKLNFQSIQTYLESIDTIEESSLSHHLMHEHGANGIKVAWEKATNVNSYVPIWCKEYDKVGLPSEWKDDPEVYYHNKVLMINYFEDKMKSQDEDNQKNENDQDVLVVTSVHPYHITQLGFRRETGEWQHGYKKMRHIFLNLSTLQQLILQIYIHSNKNKITLRQVGERMGSSFARDFIIFLEEKKIKVNELDHYIEQWCHFDISGGWGKWSYSKINKWSGEINVLNNFLACIPDVDYESNIFNEDQFNSDHSPFCPIMEGYILGILKEFANKITPNKQNTVSVKETACGKKRPTVYPCKFQYKIQFKKNTKK